MALGTNHMDVTSEANFIPEIWLNELFATYEKNLVLANLIMRIPHLGRKGDTIHLPTPTRSSASAKAADTQVTLVNPTAGKVSVSLNKHYEYSFVVEDIVDLQGNSKLREMKTTDAAYALARQTDTDLQNLAATFQGGTAYSKAVIGSDGSTDFDVTANTNAGNGSAVTDLGFRNACQTLDDQDVPMYDRFFTVAPIEGNRLMGLSKWTEHSFIGPQSDGGPIVSGYIGKRYGVPIHVTTNAPTKQADDASTDYRACILGHKGSMVLCEQQKPRVQTQKVLEYIGDLTVFDCVYGVSELRDYGAVVLMVPAI